MAAPFLPQAQPVYPGNADLSKQLALLGDTIGQGIQDYRKQSLLSDVLKPGPDGKVDHGTVALKLLQAGMPREATVVASMGNQGFDQAMKQQQFGLDTRRVNLAEKAAEEKPQYQVLEDPNGGKRLLQIQPYGKGIADVTPPGGEPNNPYSTGRMNESQSKDALYSSRMHNAEKILRDPAVTSAGASPVQRTMGAIPGVGNYMVSSDFQKFDQAKRDFVNATLRRESGAVISEAEFNNADKQYFPQPGDGPEKLAQKQANRVEAIKGIAAGAGPSYKPPYTIGPNGEIVESKPKGTAPQAAPTGQPAKISTKSQYDALPSGATYVAPDGTVRTKK
jgi:hypothetical protein